MFPETTAAWPFHNRVFLSAVSRFVALEHVLPCGASPIVIDVAQRRLSCTRLEPSRYHSRCGLRVSSPETFFFCFSVSYRSARVYRMISMPVIHRCSQTVPNVSYLLLLFSPFPCHITFSSRFLALFPSIYFIDFCVFIVPPLDVSTNGSDFTVDSTNSFSFISFY